MRLESHLDPRMDVVGFGPPELFLFAVELPVLMEVALNFARLPHPFPGFLFRLAKTPPLLRKCKLYVTLMMSPLSFLLVNLIDLY